MKKWITHTIKETMTLIKLFTVGFLLFSLINTSPTYNKYQVEEVKPFVEEFIKMGKLLNIYQIEKNTKKIAIKFGKTNEKEIANCAYYMDEITINSSIWETLSVENKEEVIFHELGHCVLSIKQHTETGIMKAQGLHDARYYRLNYQYLIKDLFNSKSLASIEWDKNKYKLSTRYKLTKSELLNNKHAVARFTANWCGPCKTLAPIFDEIAKSYPDVKVYVVDVDQNPDLTNELNIRGIPFLVSIKNNKIEKTLIGLQTKEKIESLFKQE